MDSIDSKANWVYYIINLAQIISQNEKTSESKADCSAEIIIQDTKAWQI
jgi:hypothetical protein